MKKKKKSVVDLKSEQIDFFFFFSYICLLFVSSWVCHIPQLLPFPSLWRQARLLLPETALQEPFPPARLFIRLRVWLEYAQICECQICCLRMVAVFLKLFFVFIVVFLTSCFIYDVLCYSGCKQSGRRSGEGAKGSRGKIAAWAESGCPWHDAFQLR